MNWLENKEISQEDYSKLMDWRCSSAYRYVEESSVKDEYVVKVLMGSYGVEKDSQGGYKLK